MYSKLLFKSKKICNQQYQAEIQIQLLFKKKKKYMVWDEWMFVQNSKQLSIFQAYTV